MNPNTREIPSEKKVHKGSERRSGRGKSIEVRDPYLLLSLSVKYKERKVVQNWNKKFRGVQLKTASTVNEKGIFYEYSHEMLVLKHRISFNPLSQKYLLA